MHNEFHKQTAADQPQLDAVTGILGRGDTMRRIEAYLLGEGAHGIHALVMLDLDNFKLINDTLGHISGDKAIHLVAQSIQSQFRKDDIVGRIGGDEFFVFVKNVEPDTYDLRRKIAQVLSELQIMISNGDKHLITSVSAGIAIYHGDALEPKTLHNLYSEADVALYRAKRAGKNTFSFANRDLENEAPVRKDANIFDFRTVLNSLGTGIVIFKANNRSPERWTPTFCNEGYLKLTGISYSQLRERLSYDRGYSMHPDDVDKTLDHFLKAYRAKEPFQDTVRVEDGVDSYRWINVYANMRYTGGEEFFIYMVITDAHRAMQEHQLELKRYNSFLKRVEEVSERTLLTTRVNLTRNRYEIYFLSPFLAHTKVTELQSIDGFIADASTYIAYDEERADFMTTFSRAAMLETFSIGKFHTSIKLPVRMGDGHIIWCWQYADFSQNPDTGEVEGVIHLMEDDVDIRVKDHFQQMLHADYEMVADIDSETGFLTVISETKHRDIPCIPETGTHYMKNLRSRIETLIAPAFAEECFHAMQFERIKDRLKHDDMYTCTYPANTELLGHDGVFQWRFGYVGNGRDILMARREMMSFLDKKHRGNNESSRRESSKRIMSGAGVTKLFPRRTILIADDVDINREMLKIIFEDDFTIIEAEDGDETVRLIDEHYNDLALILLDYMMPKRTGLEVLVHMKLRDLTEKIPIIMVTGSATKDVNLRSFEYGISDIINKPFDSKIVRRRALNLIELYAHKEDMELQMHQWKKQAIQLHDKNEKNNQLLINTLSSVVEFRSLESGLHIRRVCALTEILLAVWSTIFPENYFDEDAIAQISRAATLHDIGKVAIPDNILMKPGRLTKEEFEIMKQHTVLGAEMLENFKEEDSSFYRYCYDICRYHHERSDGRGYPDGLVGDQIPIWAQIVSIVDVFDALISPRVYKAAFTPEKAVQMITNGECGAFSDKLLRCFYAAQDQIIAKSIQMAQNEEKGANEK